MTLRALAAKFALTVRRYKNRKATGNRWRIPGLTDAAQLDCANRNALSQGIDSEDSRGHWTRTFSRDLIGAAPIFACHHSKNHLTAAMTDLFKFAVTCAHAVTSKSFSRLHCSYGQSPQASPILVGAGNEKKITLDNAGEFGSPISNRSIFGSR